MSEHFAPLDQTIQVLTELGFSRLFEDEMFFDSPGMDWHGAVVQLHVYQCANKYWCVLIDGGYSAPIVWNGPKAEWDTSNPRQDFIAWLDKYHPGWR